MCGKEHKLDVVAKLVDHCTLRCGGTMSLAKTNMVAAASRWRHQILPPLKPPLKTVATVGITFGSMASPLAKAKQAAKMGSCPSLLLALAA